MDAIIKRSYTITDLGVAERTIPVSEELKGGELFYLESFPVSLLAGEKICIDISGNRDAVKMQIISNLRGNKKPLIKEVGKREYKDFLLSI